MSDFTGKNWCGMGYQPTKNLTMKTLILALVAALLVTACAPDMNAEQDNADVNAEQDLQENPASQTNKQGRQTIYNENWTCEPSYGRRGSPITLRAIKVPGKNWGLGGVTMDGTTVAGTASFTIQGINRSWSWDADKNGGYRYSFVIRPDHRGLFYDFTGKKTAKPSAFFDCKRQ